MKKLLVDVTLGSLGYSGIPQDSKWLLETLALLKKYEVTGLIYGQDSCRNYLLEEKTPKNVYIIKLLARLTNPTPDQVCSLEDPILNKGDFELYSVDKKLYFDLIWRYWLSSGLTNKKFIEENVDFVLSNLGNGFLTTKALRHENNWTLDTEGYDVAIFQDARPIKCSDNTKQIIRYHDPLPITALDAFAESYNCALSHYYRVKYCLENGAKFVCNSEVTREGLLNLFGNKYADNAVKIPYRISSIFQKGTKSTHEDAVTVINAKQSQVFNTALTMPKDQQYILGVATIEPRKNWLNWMKSALLAIKDQPITMVICGGMGWRNKEIMLMMEGLNKQGRLIYLKDVHPIELEILYHHATLFMFPTVAEGFGLPPIEAQACGCPVITSDIPVHHECQGEGSLYVDPYDIRDMSEKIKWVLENRGGREMLNKILLGLENVKQYRQEVTSKQWEDYIEKL